MASFSVSQNEMRNNKNFVTAYYTEGENRLKSISKFHIILFIQFWSSRFANDLQRTVVWKKEEIKFDLMRYVVRELMNPNTLPRLF